MKTIIITQARYGSTRLPGKVLKTIGTDSLLGIHLQRLKKSRLADKILVATTNELEAEKIVEIAKIHDCLYYQGSLNDVLDRYYQAAVGVGADVIVRVTSDCPLIDASIIDTMLSLFNESDVDYLSNIHPPTFPDGVDIEIFSFSALEKAWTKATEEKEREHVTPYIWGHSEKFRIINHANQTDMSKYRLTVDTNEDFELITNIVSSQGKNKKWEEYIGFLIANPKLCRLNHHFQRNEGY